MTVYACPRTLVRLCGTASRPPVTLPCLARDEIPNRLHRTSNSSLRWPPAAHAVPGAELHNLFPHPAPPARKHVAATSRAHRAAHAGSEAGLPITHPVSASARKSPPHPSRSAARVRSACLLIPVCRCPAGPTAVIAGHGKHSLLLPWRTRSRRGRRRGSNRTRCRAACSNRLALSIASRRHALASS